MKNIYYVFNDGENYVLWDKETGAARTNNGFWMNSINEKLLGAKDIIPIFEDEKGNRVIWDRRTGSIKTNDGPWLNMSRKSNTLKENSSDEIPQITSEFCQDVADDTHIATVERELNEKILSIKETPSKVIDLFISYFSIEFIENHFQITRCKDLEEVYRIRLFSPESEYIIYIDYARNYIGCIRNNRKKRPGETWKRGNDFPDGKIFPDTVYNIMNSIFSDVFESTSKIVRKD